MIYDKIEQKLIFTNMKNPVGIQLRIGLTEKQD
jgi:hypothetical protein